MHIQGKMQNTCIRLKTYTDSNTGLGCSRHLNFYWYIVRRSKVYWEGEKLSGAVGR